MSTRDTHEQRIIDLEMRITHQDDLVDRLNSVIYEQQKQIDQLIKKMSALEKQSEDPTAPRNEKPPHY
ncbi:SlyX family protein [soil metagenome]